MSVIRAGRTFMMPLPRTGVLHLFIVLTNPDPITNKVVAVMVVSEKSTTDKTVTLHPGDHAFVQWDSNIDYGGAQTYRVEILESIIAAGNRALRENIPPPLLEIVRGGIYSSTHTMNWVKNYCATRFDDKGRDIVPPSSDTS